MFYWSMMRLHSLKQHNMKTYYSSLFDYYYLFDLYLKQINSSHEFYSSYKFRSFKRKFTAHLSFEPVR